MLPLVSIGAISNKAAPYFSAYINQFSTLCILHLTRCVFVGWFIVFSFLLAKWGMLTQSVRIPPVML